MSVHGITGALRRGRYLWSIDFSAMTPGAIATPANFTFTRSGGNATVQTSASTMLSSIAADTMRVFSNGTWTGLRIEETSTNVFVQSHNLAGASMGTASGATINTPNAAAGPDGAVTAHHTAVNATGYGGYSNVTVTPGQHTVQTWHKHPTGSGPWQGDQYVSLVVQGLLSTVTSTWKVFTAIRANSHTTAGFGPVDGRANGNGTSDQAINALTDWHQAETLAYPTSAILTAGASATRAGERWRRVSGSDSVDGGSLALEIVWRPLGSSSQYVGNRRIWTSATDATTFAEFNVATGAIVVSIAGVTYTTPVAASWAAGDEVSIYIRAGGGVATAIQYRIASGAAIVLTTGSPTAFGTLSFSGALDLWCNAATAQPSGDIVTCHALSAGQKPTWAV